MIYWADRRPRSYRLFVFARVAILTILVSACSAPDDNGDADRSAGAALSWNQAMDRLYDSGFDDIEGLRRSANGCWSADTFALGMKTTAFIDRSGGVHIEFPPESCGRRNQ